MGTYIEATCVYIHIILMNNLFHVLLDILNCSLICQCFYSNICNRDICIRDICGMDIKNKDICNRDILKVV